MNQAVETVPPVATASDFELALAANPKVTAAGSRFGDEVWDLSAEMSAVRKRPCEKRIDFRMQVRGRHVVKYSFPEGKGLADYPLFHSHAKRLMAAMILSPRNKLGPVYAAKSLINTLGALRRIYCRLAREGYTELEQVPQWAFESFTKEIKSYTSELLATLRLIHVYRDLVPAFTFDPWRLTMATPAAQACAKKRYQSPTEPIPDPAFRQLLRVCVAYVQERAGPILDAREALARVRAERVARNLAAFYPSKESWKIHESLWKGLELEKIYPDHGGTRAQLESVERVLDACRHLQTAAVALLFATTGMRLNELLTIKLGCIKHTIDGAVERVWIESMHSKYADRAGGDRARWLCGPMGEQAVAVLTRLSEPTRRESRTEYLIGPLAESGRHRIKNVRTSYKSGSANAFFSSKLWWRRFLHEHAISGAAGTVVHIHAHQFRRTFARWCALSDSSTGLLALKDHFASSAEPVGKFWFWKGTEIVIENKLEDFEGAMSVAAG